jgi:hypothetical protein
MIDFVFTFEWLNGKNQLVRLLHLFVKADDQSKH